MSQSKPLAIDLYAGLGGWTEGLLAEGYRVVGFDIERHDYGTGGYPAQLVLQDVLTLHGAQFCEASLIVASPPCQFWSRMAMPFKCPWKSEELERRTKLSASLWEACFRIQREASQAAGCVIPLVIENVKGAQPWVGRARWHYGSFYLWGDVPALMPSAHALAKVPGLNWSGSDQPGYVAKAFNGTAIKNNGGSWFAIGSPGQSNVGQNPDGRKVGAAAYQAGAIMPVGVGSTSWFHGNKKHQLRGTSSGSQARKAASAQIAKIPLPLSRWIARTYLP